VAITPNEDQFLELATSEKEGEVVMLNLLRYKPRASAGEGSGEEAYRQYGSEAVKMVEERGGKVLWMGSPDQVLIGDQDANQWDAVALVAYPNRKAFIDMVSQPAYLKSHEHRESGLADTVLIAMTPSPLAPLSAAD
jgi:uncharacterized protein (DUF1330 family)